MNNARYNEMNCINPKESLAEQDNSAVTVVSPRACLKEMGRSGSEIHGSQTY